MPPAFRSRSRSCLALVLDLAIALQLDWKPSFGAILIVVLQTPALGATYKKGILYIAGTLSGAIVGLALVALFAHDRVAFIVAAALLITFGIYRQQMSRYPYAWLIFSVTFILVAFFSTQAFDYSFEIAVMRASTICLAVRHYVSRPRDTLAHSGREGFRTPTAWLHGGLPRFAVTHEPGAGRR